MLEEYPRNLMELEAMFSTEETCRAYLAACDGRMVSAVHGAVEAKPGRFVADLYFNVWLAGIRLR